ncbi:hypothetical protein SAMN04487786_4106 [Paenisporosarcina quisquiliarum]|nr:hypothetical protein SAMN04487786_4106 [Paenisporosarcina quisquiliarum]
MKNYHYKHKVKLRTKQPDLIAYLIKLLLGTLPFVCYFLIDKALTILKEVGISLSLPDYFFLIACVILMINTLSVWYMSPLSLSETQRMKNLLRKIIEVNKFYYENNELNKIILSMVIKFYWLDNKLYLEIYTNGGQFTHKMNELTSILQTALNMTVLAVQDDYADHTTYILTNETSNIINATNRWD